jgi:hypothetical protein
VEANLTYGDSDGGVNETPGKFSESTRGGIECGKLSQALHHKEDIDPDDNERDQSTNLKTELAASEDMTWQRSVPGQSMRWQVQCHTRYSL